MLDTLRRAKKTPSHMVNIDEDFRCDVTWWLNNIRYWNGISTMCFNNKENMVVLNTSTDGWEGGTPGLGGTTLCPMSGSKPVFPPHG